MIAITLSFRRWYRSGIKKSASGLGLGLGLACGVLLLVAACAKPPRQALDATEYLVARAYAHQAPFYANDEYQAAYAALEDARRLLAAENYPAAEAALAYSREHALRAYELTDRIRIQRDEAARLEAEEAFRRAEEEGRRRAEEAVRLKAEEEARRKAEEEARKAAETRMLTEYRVGANDTLASIAALAGVYADPYLWPLLYQANRDQIKDPAQIYVGQMLRIPRNLPAGDYDSARQKARESGLFGLAANGAKALAPR